MTALWVAAIVASIGSWALKFAGLSLPESILGRPAVQRVAAYLPVAMLSALVVVEVFDAGGHWGVDWRTLAGLGVAVVLLALRRGFLVVFFGAIAATALLRLLT